MILCTKILNIESVVELFVDIFYFPWEHIFEVLEGVGAIPLTALVEQELLILFLNSDQHLMIT